MAERQDRTRKEIAELRELVARAKRLIAALETREKRAKPGPSAAVPPGMRSANLSKAPGKQHRQPPASTRGVKHSQLHIAKARASSEFRRRQRT